MIVKHNGSMVESVDGWAILEDVNYEVGYSRLISSIGDDEQKYNS